MPAENRDADRDAELAAMKTGAAIACPAAGLGPFIPVPMRWLCLCGAALITVLLFYLGAQPFAVGLFPEPWDKLAHLLAFSSITGLLWVATAGRRPLWLIGIVSTIGALDELHQAGLPGRSMDLADWLTDIGAAILAVIVLGAWQRRGRR